MESLSRRAVLWLALWWMRNRTPDETISDGHGRAYLLRWRVLPVLYLHQMVAPDRAKDPHDHPRGFTAWILRGGYEESIGLTGWLLRYNSEGDVVRNRADHVHRITRVEPDTATLVLWHSVRRRPWGFRTPMGWVPAQSYFLRNPDRT